MNWSGRPGLQGDRFAGWGLGGCWAGCSGDGRVGCPGEKKRRSHGEGSQVLRLQLGPGFGHGLGFSLEEGLAEVGLAAPLPAARRGCQVGSIAPQSKKRKRLASNLGLLLRKDVPERMKMAGWDNVLGSRGHLYRHTCADHAAHLVAL